MTPTRNGSGSRSGGLDLDRLAAAKLWLTSAQGDQPYLSTALYALQVVASADVPAVTADRSWRLYVNPGWLAATPVPQVAAGLAHVTWHLLLDHAERAVALDVGAREAPAWRTAADVTVGETLTAAGMTGLGLPEPGPLGLTPHRPAEEHYAVLARLPSNVPDQPDDADDADDAEKASSASAEKASSASAEKASSASAEKASSASAEKASGASADESCGSSGDGLARRYEVPSDADVGGVDALEAAEIRRRVAIEFRGHVTARGTDPGDALRWVTYVLDPVVPWTQVLAAAVRRAAGWANGHTDYTYSRPSRRAAASPRVVLPATRRPVPRVAVVVDTSASMDDGLLAQALGEVDGAIRGLGVAGSDVTVLTCDAAVHTVASVRRGRDVRLAGAGGTDLQVGLAAAAAVRPHPDVAVVLTDGWTPWPVQPPRGLATVVAVLRRDDAPAPPTPAWATRVDCVLP